MGLESILGLQATRTCAVYAQLRMQNMRGHWHVNAMLDCGEGRRSAAPAA